jgi:branched-chain amino acid transport system ATP-binding protein
MPPTLELSGVHAGYGPLDVLFSVDLAAADGKVTAILGPNGAGKTTSLKVAAGLVAATAGSVRHAGEDVTASTPRAIAQRGLCLIPEGRGIFPSLTVRENLKLQSKLPGAGSYREVEEIACARFPRLRERLKQTAGTLSGGEQQMLALSRALTTAPSVILIDEISMGLAPNLVEDLFGVILALAAEGRTIVLVEQLAEYTMEIADFVAVMAKGKVAAFGQPDDVRPLLEDLYLGRVEGAEHAADAPVAHREGTGLWATPSGSLMHLGSCPAVAHRADARQVTAGAGLEPCGLCDPVAVPVAA